MARATWAAASGPAPSEVRGAFPADTWQSEKRAPFHGARPGNQDAQALSFCVQEAGTPGVNGIYVRTATKTHGTDVYVQKGTTFALVRRSENHWSLADLGGGPPDRWNLRSIELYRCDRVPGGFVPPDFGWKPVEGYAPCPFIFAAKNPSVKLTLPSMLPSKSAPQLQLRPKSGTPKIGAATFGNTRKDEMMRAKAAPVGAAQPLYGSSHAALTAGLSREFPLHVNFLHCFSVVLTRPNTKVGWGCRWKEDVYQDAGARELDWIEDCSPLARWNTWQMIRGRPDICALPEDRVIKVDGRWAFYEIEIGNDENDPDDESTSLARKTFGGSGIPLQSAFDGRKAGKSCNNIVIDFARKEVLRPMPPAPPKAVQPQTEALLEVSWKSLGWQPRQMAWAVIVQEVSVRMWYAIDAAGTARPFAAGEEYGAILGDYNSITILKGLTRGRTYAASVAVFTEHGWSAFSALSRAVTLSSHMTVSEILIEDLEHPAHAIDPDDWRDRPRFVVPSRIVPGSTAPVGLLQGPKTFLATRRRMQQKVIVRDVDKGGMEGLELSPVDFCVELSRDSLDERVGLGCIQETDRAGRPGFTLIVTDIQKGGLMDQWNSVNPPQVQVRKDDRILAINAFSRDPKRMNEVLKTDLFFRITVVKGPAKQKVVNNCGECGQQFLPEDKYCRNCNWKRPDLDPQDNERLSAEKDRQLLRVERIRPGTKIARWCQECESQGANLHGQEVGPGLRVGDKILSINGLTGAAKMVAEIQRKPRNLAMTIERVLGHDAEGTDAAINRLRNELKETIDSLLLQYVTMNKMHLQPAVQEIQEQISQMKQQRMMEVGESWLPADDVVYENGKTRFEDEIFPMDYRLDTEAVKLAEEVQWNSLLCPSEGELAMSIVGSEMEQLEFSLEAVLQLSQDATLAAGNRPPRYTYHSLVNDAESRVLLFDRRAKTENDRTLLMSTPVGSRRLSMTGQPPEQEDQALTALKSALVDVRCDPAELRGAIALFEKGSPAVKSSPAAKKMLRRADALVSIWAWRDRYERMRQRFVEVMEQSLIHEKERMDNDSDDEEETKPYDVHALEGIIEEAQEFADELQYELVEMKEIVDRQADENSRQAAKQQLQVALGDPREDKAVLQTANDKCKEVGVPKLITDQCNEMLEYLQRKHKRDAAREAIKKAVKGLQEKLQNREKPGAGSDEQRIVREALEEAQLDEDDPLHIEARDLLAQWKTANSVLRAEAKLHSALKRTKGGPKGDVIYKHSEPRAGDLLGSAIAQVATEGVDYQRLEEARDALTKWEFSRKNRAESDLANAMKYSDVEGLREAIEFGLQAGLTEEYLAPHRARLQRLRYEQEITQKLTDAMDVVDTPLLEKCINFAHEKMFVEEEYSIVMSATMQIQLRFWTEEFRHAAQVKCAEGLQGSVDYVTELVERCKILLGPTPPGLDQEPEFVRNCLIKDLRPLELLLPTCKDMAAVFSAEAELNRVLGAVERYAEDLPEVIANGQAQIRAGVNENLLKAAMDHHKAYDHTIKELQKYIDSYEDEEKEELGLQPLKAALIKAFLAGAPQKLIKKAWKILETYDGDLFKYAEIELELLVALAEADDIEEMSVEARFLRLQNASDEARRLNPPLIGDIWERVQETSVALAAERTLVLQVRDAEHVLSGLTAEKPSSRASSKPGTANSQGGDGGRRQSSGGSEGGRRRSSTSRRASKAEDPPPPPPEEVANQHSAGTATAEDIEKMAEGIARACISAEQSALEEAKKMIEPAEDLRERLLEEASIRRKARAAVNDQKNKRHGSSKELRLALINAREVCVPEHLLEEAYTQLRDMKVAFLTEDLNAANVAGHRALAIACWFRAQALRFEGLGPQGGSLQDCLGPEALDIISVQGMMQGVRCGGSFGTSTWRQNPQFSVRYSEGEMQKRQQKLQQREHGHAVHGPDVVVNVTVAVAEGGSIPALLSVHVVRNNEEATAAGCQSLLVPGYEVLACSDINDDLPTASFELPPYDEKRPVFIVPSAAKGEEGPFTIVVEADHSIDIVEVEDSVRDCWTYHYNEDVEWSDKMPYRKYKGGPREQKVAPPLSWYRNPQYRVKLKSQAQVAREKAEAKAAAESAATALTSEFPFALEEDSEEEQQTQESDMATTLESSKHEAIGVGIEVFSAGDFHDAPWITTTDIFVSCEIKDRSEEVFVTEAVKGSGTPTWNYKHYCTDFMTDNTLVFKIWRIIHDTEDTHTDGAQEMAQVSIPYVQFKDGMEASVGLLTHLDEVNRNSGAALRQCFWGQLKLKLTVMEVAEAEKAEAAFLGSLARTTTDHMRECASLRRYDAKGHCIATPADLRISSHHPLSSDGFHSGRPISGRPKSGRPESQFSSATSATFGKPGTAQSVTKAAILQARLMPADQNQQVPAAVHIIKNHEIEEEVAAKELGWPPMVHEARKRAAEEAKEAEMSQEETKALIEEAHEEALLATKDRRINENPYHHNLVASSGVAPDEYVVASELGCVCKLIPGETEEDEGEPVFVIPSLSEAWSDGKFMLQLLSTEDIIVERVN